MKAYKNLETYNQTFEGFVRDVKVIEDGLTVVKRKIGYATVQLLYTMVCLA